MFIGYQPTEQVVREHLEHARRTAHLLEWQRGDFSIALLLGLRDGEIDAKLRELAPDVSGDSAWTLGSKEILDAVEDASVGRLIRAMAITGVSSPFAWARLTPDEVRVVARELLATPRAPTGRCVALSTLHLTLYELIDRFGAPELLTDLERPTSATWLESALFARLTGGPPPKPALVENAFPSWIPTLPLALLRDPMTRLLSRNALFENPHRFRLPDSTVFAPLPTRDIVMLDVDHMKHILDFYGMNAGDVALCAIAECLHRLVGDRVVRFGGDEFLILVDCGSAREVAQAAVEAVRSLQVSLPDQPDVSFPLSISAGVAQGDDVHTVLSAAEEALVLAKRNGRNQIAVSG